MGTAYSVQELSYTKIMGQLQDASNEEGFSFYWYREKDKEVDFVIESGTMSLTAIEVKSGIVKNTQGSMEFKKLYPHAYCLTVGSQDLSVEDFLSGKGVLFK